MSRAKDVHFYFDFGDPRSYLTWHPLIHFCQNQPINLLLHPVLKEQFPETIVEEWRELLPKLVLNTDIKLRLPEKEAFSTRLALQMSLPDVCHSAQYVVVDCLLKTCWRQGLDISDHEVLVSALDSEGLDGYDLFQRAMTSSANKTLDRLTGEALAKGITSVPLAVMDGSPLTLIDEALGLQLVRR